jgi:hypothetical protein
VCRGKVVLSGGRLMGGELADCAIGPVLSHRRAKIQLLVRFMSFLRERLG